MMKKFNLLIEEIENEIDKDYRFLRCSRYLSRALTDKEKSDLNKKYNEIVKEELINANKSNEELTVYYVNDQWSGKRPRSKIEKVWEENGKWFCTFLSHDYEAKVKMHLSYFEHSTWGPNKEDWEKDPEKCKRIAEERARKDCEMTEPISHITTEKILDMMYDEEKARTSYKVEDYDNIFEKASDDVKYLVENNFISKKAIIDALSKCIPTSLQVKRSCDKDMFTNDEALSKFNVDKNDKQFKEAEEDSSRSGESWYYNGGVSLILFTKLNVSEGQRFDISRVSSEKFESKFERSSGYGTTGEF